MFLICTKLRWLMCSVEYGILITKHPVNCYKTTVTFMLKIYFY